MDLELVLRRAVELGASDIHLKVERPPIVRRDGALGELEGEVELNERDLELALEQVCAETPKRLQTFLETGELDSAFAPPGLPRFRVNGFRQRGSISIAFRVIPREVPDFGDLSLPPGVRRLAEEHRGLVLSTMHTVDASETIGRMVEFFPAVKQSLIRSILAGVLRGVISQRLLPRIDSGRIPAVEVMVGNARIADLIRDNKPDEITEAIAEGDFFQMQTFSQALIHLVLEEKVDREVAANAASNRHDFLIALERALKERAAAAAAQLESAPDPVGEGEPTAPANESNGPAEE